MTKASDYRVTVCDQYLNPIGTLAFEKITMVEKYCDVGKATITCPGSERNLKLISRGSQITIADDTGICMAGPLTSFGGGFTQAGSMLTLEMAGPEVYLSDRLAWPDPKNEVNAQGKDYDVRKGPATSVILGYIDANLGQGALPYRRINSFVAGKDRGRKVRFDEEYGVWIGDDEGAGAIITGSARFENLLDLVRRLAVQGLVLFTFNTKDRRHTVNVQMVRDLSASIKFSAKTHTISSGTWKISAPTKTDIIVGGSGEGASRVFVAVSTAESNAAELLWGARRIEKFKDERSLPTPELRASGVEEVRDGAETVEAAFSPTDLGSLQYGKDYRLGDLVTVVLPTNELVVKPIREVTTIVSQSTGRVVRPIAGDYGASSSTGNAMSLKETQRQVAALQYNR